ncbi:MAG: bifunctional (p)ppGpp synthetase/guanosine-3',5'-bis(diphosphate) 3'-pyrophosphohydrolase [Steroidobacteraceae bacterium]
MQTAQLCPPEISSTLDSLAESIAQALGLVPNALAEAQGAAEIAGALSGDRDLASALLLAPVLDGAKTLPPALARLAGPASVSAAEALARFGELGFPAGWSPEQGLDARQAEAVRKMLIAAVSDPRLVLARLAMELVRLRRARGLEPREQQRAALAARAVFAPLANRLGVWQLKWELEDLAFRYLEPEAYRRIALALNEKRSDRERYIASLRERLRAELAAAGIAAQVEGRPKHLYSIHRKMQRKQLDFGELYDIRAVRIILETVEQCYAALGVVHAEFAPIASEFDDYIASPKENLYRSIHTAIVGPEGASVEVQIRTREMHEHAELGVAAHWQYKEGGARDRGYERKIEAVRRLLKPGDVGGGERDFLERERARLFSDRLYALTPKGEVIDLPRGATPLDFAYHVHSDLGHRCRGAKVNGRIAPLTQALANGEVVEIIAGKHPAPSRDWLAPELGYLASPRSRAKVRAWFRRQASGDNRVAGRSILERELARAGAGPEVIAPLVQAFDAGGSENLHQLLGEAQITATQLAQTLARLKSPSAARARARLPGARTPLRAAPQRHRSPVEVEGVGDLPITLARCCAPSRPQSIVGYATVGRGVTIHRKDCPSLARMFATHPQRVLRVDWIAESA